MGEENSESTTPFNELSREEYLERHVWTLQYYFEDLLKEDVDLASDYIKWAIGVWLDTLGHKDLPK